MKHDAMKHDMAMPADSTMSHDKMAKDKMGSDKMGSDKMAKDKMGSDKMGSDKMAKDKMGADKMGTDKMGKDAMMMAPHGMFAGAHDHKVSGGYTITNENGHQTLRLANDFSVDGAPDPYVVLSPDAMGSGDHVLNLGRLKQKRGASTFDIPAGTDLSQYHSVLIWSKKYNATLGQAELAAGGAMMHN